MAALRSRSSIELQQFSVQKNQAVSWLFIKLTTIRTTIYMNNALKYGAILGVLSGLWIFLMHSLGVYNQNDNSAQMLNWAEYLSVLIPFFCLYFGIKHYRDHKR